jgi:hypothetical protein
VNNQLEPRACFRCGRVKDADDFPMGSRSRSEGDRRRDERRRPRRSTVCTDCWDAEGERRKARRAQTKQQAATWKEGRCWYRRCAKCLKRKQLCRRNFYSEGRYANGKTRWRYTCRRCDIERVEGLKAAEREADPAAFRARQAAYMRAWRASNPEAARAASARHRARINANPELRARKNEQQRLNSRMRREREGHDLSAPMKTKGHVKYVRSGKTYDANPERRVPHPDGNGDAVPVWCPAFESGPRKNGRVKQPHYRMSKPPELPSGPLADRVQAVIEARENGGDPHRITVTKEELCGTIGISSRSLERWLGGARTMVQFEVADRVLTALELNWWDVWEPAEYPEVAAALG